MNENEVSEMKFQRSEFNNYDAKFNGNANLRS